MALTLLMTAGWVEGLREDELLCEETAARLADCCPDFDPSVLECSYVSGCGTTTFPAITIAESACIDDLSCSQLIGRGVCARAAKATQPTEHTDEDGTTTTEQRVEVCP
ncbi:hypothetical protein [Polyangium aurulentum]|uniref:hypothetical protein n=1 Tax=Polyangium aurulentum TaxID=2567896 RepID=UPI0010AE0B77|nr:hypothetical protein [Polyangium aurulentum]UQA60765.1 hypothetical protein E8A73_009900 [Polyangium aurulentum]